MLSHLDGKVQTLEVVEAEDGMPLRDGHRQPRETSLCQLILDGELPQVLPDLRKFPAAMQTAAAQRVHIRSFVSVPVTLSDGTVYGTFCAGGLSAHDGLTERDTGLLQVLAQAAALIIEPDVRAAERESALNERYGPLMAAGGPSIVWQPIVELPSARFRGAESLSRFPRDWGKPPDVCFDEAHEIGVGHELELQALLTAVSQAGDLPGYAAINISPTTLVQPATVRALTSLASDRLLLELSEHEAVADYDVLNEVLAPLRARGMRLAIDDVGSGFSSLRHVLLTRPDVLKLDRSMVAGVKEGMIRFDLIKSLADFGHRFGASVIAEGVEEESEAEALTQAGIDKAQGWFFGKPAPIADLLSSLDQHLAC